jgi:hypothetical protein
LRSEAETPLLPLALPLAPTETEPLLRFALAFALPLAEPEPFADPFR